MSTALYLIIFPLIAFVVLVLTWAIIFLPIFFAVYSYQQWKRPPSDDPWDDPIDPFAERERIWLDTFTEWLHFTSLVIAVVVPLPTTIWILDTFGYPPPWNIPTNQAEFEKAKQQFEADMKTIRADIDQRELQSQQLQAEILKAEAKLDDFDDLIRKHAINIERFHRNWWLWTGMTALTGLGGAIAGAFGKKIFDARIWPLFPIWIQRLGQPKPPSH